MSLNSERKTRIKAEKQQAQKERTAKQVDEMVEDVPKLIQSKEYKAIAALAADQGASYLEEELDRGVSEEKASFKPEVHIYKDGKLFGVGVLANVESQADVDKFIRALFETTPTMVVVLVNGIWVSKMSMKNGGRPSPQPDRVNAGLGTVYLASDNIVARVAKPVFSNIVHEEAVA